MQTGFQYIASQRKVVYYNNAGQMQYGRQKINGRTYDMNRMTGAVSHGSGQQNIGGKWYLFNKNGTARTGFQWIANQKKTVYYNNKGEMQYGQQRIGNGCYLFSWGTGAMQTGLQNLKNYGENKTVYYERNGRMQYGQRNIRGHWYLFQNGTGKMATGFQNLKSYGQDKIVYYAGNGQMQYGQQHLFGHWYLFDKNTGAMAKGLKWIANQKKTVYYNNEGQMQYGQQRIGNGWYLFSWGTGAMQTGLQNLKNYGENKTVYI